MSLPPHPFRTPPPAAPARRLARRALARAAGALARAEAEPSLRILTYHRVNDRHPGDRMTVHPEAFRRQLEALAGSGRPVLPLGEAAARLRGLGEPLPARAVCLTLDDGYRDNLECAAPILASFGFPAVVFVVTGRMGAATTIERYEGCCDGDQALSWDEARELRAAGHEIGGHGRTHRELATLDAPSLRDELSGCREDLLRELGEPPRLFCYPRGSEDAAVRSALGEAGFETAVTVYPGVNTRASEPLLLRRTEVSGQDDVADFRLKLAGAYDALHRAWQRLRPRGA